LIALVEQAAVFMWMAETVDNYGFLDTEDLYGS